MLIKQFLGRVGRLWHGVIPRSTYRTSFQIWAMRIRRREKLFLALKGYRTYTYSWNQFFLPIPSTQTKKAVESIHYFLCWLLLVELCMLSCDQCKSEIHFVLKPVSPSFLFSLSVSVSGLFFPVFTRPIMCCLSSSWILATICDLWRRGNCGSVTILRSSSPRLRPDDHWGWAWCGWWDNYSALVLIWVMMSGPGALASL